MRANISSREDIALPSEVALALGISRERAVRLVQGGFLQGELIAGRWVISRKSLERYLARRASTPLDAA